MKGLILAAVSFVILGATSVVLLRIYRGKKYFEMFLVSFGVAVVAYASLYRIFPPNLGFVPVSLLEPHQGIDFWNGILALSLSFHIFWDVAYASALTGFSSNLMILLLDSPGLSMDEILKIYGTEAPLDQILSWRLPNLLRGRYVAAEGEGFRLLRKGRAVGTVGSFLKRMLGAGEGG